MPKMKCAVIEERSCVKESEYTKQQKYVEETYALNEIRYYIDEISSTFQYPDLDLES